MDGRWHRCGRSSALRPRTGTLASEKRGPAALWSGASRVMPFGQTGARRDWPGQWGTTPGVKGGLTLSPVTGPLPVLRTETRGRGRVRREGGNRPLFPTAGPGSPCSPIPGGRPSRPVAAGWTPSQRAAGLRGPRANSRQGRPPRHPGLVGRGWLDEGCPAPTGPPSALLLRAPCCNSGLVITAPLPASLQPALEYFTSAFICP